MLPQARARRLLYLLIVPCTVFAIIFLLHAGLDHGLVYSSQPTEKPKPLFKVAIDPPPPPIVDNFPLAATAKSSSDLPEVPSWNLPHKPDAELSTPLFIGFTRNWRLLQQVVVSYITAGWPPGDIYVIENTGVMNSNRDGLLTLQNPFYLDHHRLTKILGINVISTPTLFTFAQLQNFYVYTALEHKWDHYFWAHMDTVVVSDEATPDEPYKSLYTRAVEALESTLEPSFGPLATMWFAYDRLALVRTQAFVDVGGWDTMIPFYMTDCDMHERLWMKDFKIESGKVGKVWDVAETLDDLGTLYQRGEIEPRTGEREETAPNETSTGEKRTDQSPTPSSLSSSAYHALLTQLDILQTRKLSDTKGRNTWQARQKGGQGEPFYRNSDGFEKALSMWMDLGREVFWEKWGRGPCDLRDSGLVDGDEWRVVRDWERGDVRRKYWRQRAKEGKKGGKGRR